MANKKSGQHMTTKTKKRLILYGVSILLVCFICFGFLSIHQFKDWTLFPFFESMLGVFMGAGGEGYKGFKTQKELLDESVWDQASRPDPKFYQ